MISIKIIQIKYSTLVHSFRKIIQRLMIVEYFRRHLYFCADAITKPHLIQHDLVRHRRMRIKLRFLQYTDY